MSFTEAEFLDALEDPVTWEAWFDLLSERERRTMQTVLVEFLAEREAQSPTDFGVGDE